jgi:hypothetical protein
MVVPELHPPPLRRVLIVSEFSLSTAVGEEWSEEGGAGPDARTDFRRSALPFLARKKISERDMGNSSRAKTKLFTTGRVLYEPSRGKVEAGAVYTHHRVLGFDPHDDGFTLGRMIKVGERKYESIKKRGSTNDSTIRPTACERHYVLVLEPHGDDGTPRGKDEIVIGAGWVQKQHTHIAMFSFSSHTAVTACRDA